MQQQQQQQQQLVAPAAAAPLQPPMQPAAHAGTPPPQLPPPTSAVDLQRVLTVLQLLAAQGDANQIAGIVQNLQPAVLADVVLHLAPALPPRHALPPDHVPLEPWQQQLLAQLEPQTAPLGPGSLPPVAHVAPAQQPHAIPLPGQAPAGMYMPQPLQPPHVAPGQQAAVPGGVAAGRAPTPPLHQQQQRQPAQPAKEATPPPAAAAAAAAAAAQPKVAAPRPAPAAPAFVLAPRPLEPEQAAELRRRLAAPARLHRPPPARAQPVPLQRLCQHHLTAAQRAAPARVAAQRHVACHCSGRDGAGRSDLSSGWARGTYCPAQKEAAAVHQHPKCTLPGRADAQNAQRCSV